MQEELQKLKEEFEERIKELEEKHKTEEGRPKVGDHYWYVNGHGEVCSYEWNDDSFDITAFENNVIFKTKEEAEFEAERLKVLRELEKVANPFNFSFENWYVYLDKDSNVNYSFKYLDRLIYGNYYFRSKGEAVKAIKAIGEERIKKYLFGVGD